MYCVSIARTKLFLTSLPGQAFSQPVEYHRLTGAFRPKWPSLGRGDVPGQPATPCYGLTDSERERMVEWAQLHRLPYFVKYALFDHATLHTMYSPMFAPSHAIYSTVSFSIEGGLNFYWKYSPLKKWKTFF